MLELRDAAHMIQIMLAPENQLNAVNSLINIFGGQTLSLAGIGTVAIPRTITGFSQLPAATQDAIFKRMVPAGYYKNGRVVLNREDGMNAETLEEEMFHAAYAKALTEAERDEIKRFFKDDEHAYHGWFKGEALTAGRAAPGAPPAARILLAIRDDQVWDTPMPKTKAGQGQVRFSLASPIDSPAFKAWFGDSVVTVDGKPGSKPLVVYHGTAMKGDVIRGGMGRRPGLHSQGIWLTPSYDNAQEYADHAAGDGQRRIISAYLAIKNPATVYQQELADVTIEELVAQGYDGAYDGQTGAWIAFSPTQIKSATANVGTYDPNNPDIRFSLPSPKLGAGFALDDETLFGVFRRTFQDKFLAVRQLQRRLKASGGTLRQDMDVYALEELSHGKIGNDLAAFDRDLINPLVKAIKDSGLELDYLGTLLHARHAKERNRYIASINPAFGSDPLLAAEVPAGSGMPDEVADQIIASAKKSGDWAKAQPVFRAHDDINAARLDLIEQAGLENAETIRKAKGRYKFYTPLRGHKGEFMQEGLDELGGVKYPDQDPVKLRRTLGFDARGKELDRALGRVSIPENPLIVSLMMMNNTIIHARQNEVALAFLRLVKANPNPDLWEVDKLQMRAFFDEKKGVVRHGTNKAAQKRLEETFIAIQDGQEVWITIHHDGLLRAMKSLGTQNQMALIRAMGTLTRTFAALNTQWSPEFVATNLLRDLQTAAIHIGGEVDMKMARQVVKDVGSFMGGLAQLSGGGPMGAVLADQRDARREAAGKAPRTHRDDTIEWLTWWDRMQQAGGRISFFGLKDFTDQVRDINRRIEQINATGGKARVKGFFRAVGGIISDTNSAVENAVRLAVFRRAVEKGFTDAQAASLALNVTVNFTRKGEQGQLMGALYAFYNASVQGNTRMLMAVVKSPRVRKLVGGLTALGAGLAMLNLFLAGEDDDGVSYWAKVSPSEKARNLILMTPWAGSGTYLKLPLPYGYNIFHAAGTYAVDAAAGIQGPGQAAGNLLATTMDAFNPIGQSSSLLQQITPTIMESSVQWAENVAWHGGPIRPTDMPGDMRPNSQRYFNSVSETSRDFTAWLNEITGGDKYTPGLIDISPELVDHAIDSTTGAAGSFVRRLASLGYNAASGDLDQVEAREVVFLRKFFGTTSDYIVSQDFNAYRKELQTVEWRLRNYERDGSVDKVQQVRQEHAKLLALKPLLDETQRQQADLQDRIDVLRDLPASKEGKLQVLEQHRRLLAADSRTRAMSVEDLNVIIQDIQRLADLSDEEGGNYIKSLEKERLRLLKEANKQVREVAGKAPRPVNSR